MSSISYLILDISDVIFLITSLSTWSEYSEPSEEYSTVVSFFMVVSLRIWRYGCYATGGAGIIGGDVCILSDSGFSLKEGAPEICTDESGD